MRAQSQRLAKRVHVDRCACDRVLARVWSCVSESSCPCSNVLMCFRVIVCSLTRAHVFLTWAVCCVCWRASGRPVVSLVVCVFHVSDRPCFTTTRKVWSSRSSMASRAATTPCAQHMNRCIILSKMATYQSWARAVSRQPATLVDMVYPVPEAVFWC